MKWAGSLHNHTSKLGTAQCYQMERSLCFQQQYRQQDTTKNVYSLKASLAQWRQTHSKYLLTDCDWTSWMLPVPFCWTLNLTFPVPVEMTWELSQLCFTVGVKMLWLATRRHLRMSNVHMMPGHQRWEQFSHSGGWKSKDSSPLCCRTNVQRQGIRHWSV